MSILQPRGIRNHNPGNLREAPGDNTAWIGERVSNDDPAFEEFTAAVYGLRALARVLLNYYRHHQCRSVSAIIERWAPPSENATAAYIAAVAARVGVPPTAPLAPLDQHPKLLKALMQAIVQHENGAGPLDNGDWYGDETYNDAIQLALGPHA